MGPLLLGASRHFSRPLLLVQSRSLDDCQSKPWGAGQCRSGRVKTIEAETATPAAPGRGSERTLAGLVRYFAKLGSSGFGGPIALVGYMHRDLVEERGWFTEDEYRQALAVGQTFPGPLAAQTGMWLGYLEAGWRGALAVIVPFVLPPFLLVTAVAIVYAEYQGLSAVHSIFEGVGPAVLAIIAIAAFKLARKTNKADPVAWAIAALLAIVTAASGAEVIWLVVLAGFFGAIWWGGALPRRSDNAARVAPPSLLATV